MKHFVEFELEDGDSIFVEVNELEQEGGMETVSRKGVVEKAEQTFEKVLDKIQPIANKVISRLRDLNEPADEVEVEFGIKMTAKLGAVVADLGGEANYRIKLKWTNKGNSKNAGKS